MANIFDSAQSYGSSWEVTAVRKFTEEEILMTKDVEIVEGEWGTSVKCFMVGGGTKFFGLGKHSRGEIGDHPDLAKARILTLEREGKSVIKIEF